MYINIYPSSDAIKCNHMNVYKVMNYRSIKSVMQIN